MRGGLLNKNVVFGLAVLTLVAIALFIRMRTPTSVIRAEHVERTTTERSAPSSEAAHDMRAPKRDDERVPKDPTRPVDGESFDSDNTRHDDARDASTTRLSASETRARLLALAQVAAAYRAAAVARGTAPTTQTPNADGIRAAMREVVPMLKDCYEPWVALNPELQGKLSASFVIGPDGGAPSDVHVEEGGLGSEALDGCVLSVVESEMRFSRSSNGEPVRVTYPLRFTSAPSP